MSVEREIAERMRPWARKGGKTNRRVQYRRLLAFGAWLDSQEGGPRALHEVGKRQAVQWYRHLEVEGRAEATVRAHGYAVRALWVRLGRDPGAVVYWPPGRRKPRPRRGRRGRG